MHYFSHVTAAGIRKQWSKELKEQSNHAKFHDTVQVYRESHEIKY